MKTAFRAGSKAARLRKLIARGCVAMPGAFNGMTARLIERAGFDAVYVSGAGLANATAGVPDVRVDGTKYGPQRIKTEQLSCTDPGTVRLYDEGSRLIVVCLGTVPCRLRLV